MASVASASLHHCWGWITAPSCEDRPVDLESLLLECTELLHLFLPLSDKFELDAASLTCWKLFALEFSVAPESCLSKYLGDPIIRLRSGD